MSDDATMSVQTGDMDVLFPQEREVKVGGETIHVSPLFFGQYPKAMKLFLPVFDAAKGLDMFFVRKTEDKSIQFGIAPDWPLRLPSLIAEGGEPVMEFVAFCAGKPRQWLDTVRGDEGIDLLRAVFGVNIDFFSQRILPKVQQVTGVVAANPQSGGATSSPVSSKQDTDGTTSSVTP